LKKHKRKKSTEKEESSVITTTAATAIDTSPITMTSATVAKQAIVSEELVQNAQPSSTNFIQASDSSASSSEIQSQTDSVTSEHVPIPPPVTGQTSEPSVQAEPQPSSQVDVSVTVPAAPVIENVVIPEAKIDKKSEEEGKSIGVEAGHVIKETQSKDTKTTVVEETKIETTKKTQELEIEQMTKLVKEWSEYPTDPHEQVKYLFCRIVNIPFPTKASKVAAKGETRNNVVKIVDEKMKEEKMKEMVDKNDFSSTEDISVNENEKRK